MEEIEAQVQEKGIERIKTEIKEVEVKPKPKKERTQAQKEAFEKARKKRAENLKKKKEEAQGIAEAQDEAMVDYYGEPEVQPEPAPQPSKVIEAPKKRGRPRKKKVQEEPPAPHFIPPQNSMPSMYPVQGQLPFNPYAMYGFQPPPQQAPQPVVHNYYYGTNPREIKEKETIKEVEVKPEPEVMEAEINPSMNGFESEDIEEEYELPPDPRLKYRFC